MDEYEKSLLKQMVGRFVTVKYTDHGSPREKEGILKEVNEGNICLDVPTGSHNMYIPFDGISTKIQSVY